MKKCLAILIAAAHLFGLPSTANGFSFDLRGALFKSGHPKAGESLEESVLSEKEVANLVESAESLSRLPNLHFEVAGHADLYECSHELCKGLALRRAVLVYRFLLDQGVDPRQVVMLNEYGWKRPIASSREEFQANQRVELNVYSDPLEASRE